MNKKALTLFTIICSIAGITFFLIQRNWLVVQCAFIPPQTTLSSAQEKDVTTQKVAQLFYWNNETWRSEDATIIWHAADNAHNAQLLIKQWIVTLHDEHLIPQNVTLESVALSSPGTEAYISFSHSLFTDDLSTMNKWLLVEGLVKTLHAAGLGLHSIMLLIHHRPMVDDQLDFSQPLPVQTRI